MWLLLRRMLKFPLDPVVVDFAAVVVVVVVVVQSVLAMLCRVR